MATKKTLISLPLTSEEAKLFKELALDMSRKVTDGHLRDAYLMLSDASYQIEKSLAAHPKGET